MAVVPRAQQTRAERLLAGMTAGSVVMATGSAFAKDFNAALAEKEARRRRLRDSAGEAKETGKDQGQVFAVPEYSLGDEARTPNGHSRQNEGARQQNNI
uniref:Uncharacterized protein n=1 Tax=Chlamydomonas sp. HS-5 TaxID=108458 RepID=Q9XFU1_9CHLO|nr:hypothetical protein [Chlamydomonas sp. HS-5]